LGSTEIVTYKIPTPKMSLAEQLNILQRRFEHYRTLYWEEKYAQRDVILDLINVSVVIGKVMSQMVNLMNSIVLLMGKALEPKIHVSESSMLQTSDSIGSPLQNILADIYFLRLSFLRRNYIDL
jgi:hypothetical protein